MTEEIEEGKPPAQYVLVRKDRPYYVQMVNVGLAMSPATEPLTERTSAISKIVFHLKTAREHVKEDATDDRTAG